MQWVSLGKRMENIVLRYLVCWLERIDRSVTVVNELGYC